MILVKGKGTVVPMLNKAPNHADESCA